MYLTHIKAVHFSAASMAYNFKKWIMLDMKTSI